MEPRTINSLQAGRGLAALAVILTHSAATAEDFGWRFSGLRFLYFGRFGIDFFFVLSGFIIYCSTVGRDRSLKEYTLARFRRVYLPYWPIGILTALAYVASPQLRGSVESWSWLATLTLAPIDVRPALNVAWTLQHEILFYLLFGLFYYSRLLWLGLGVWALALIANLPHLIFDPINLEFLFGIAACLAYSHGRAHWGLLLLAPLAAAAAWLTKSEIVLGVMFALIIAPVAQLERARHFTVGRPLILLGAASYSLYLAHLPVVSVVSRIASNGVSILALSVLASVIVGFAYHYAIEVRVVAKRWNPEVAAKPVVN